MALFSTLVTVFGLRKSTVVNEASVRRSRTLLGESLDRVHRLRQGSGRIETFDECIARLGLSSAFLKKRRHELMIESRIMYGLMILSLFMGVYFALEANIYGVLSALCTSLIGLVGGLTRAFRVHQIDKRDLFGFHVFLSSSDGWVK